MAVTGGNNNNISYWWQGQAIVDWGVGIESLVQTLGIPPGILLETKKCKEAKKMPDPHDSTEVCTYQRVGEDSRANDKFEPDEDFATPLKVGDQVRVTKFAFKRFGPASIGTIASNLFPDPNCVYTVLRVVEQGASVRFEGAQGVTTFRRTLLTPVVKTKAPRAADAPMEWCCPVCKMILTTAPGKVQIPEHLLRSGAKCDAVGRFHTVAAPRY